ncbi:MAG: beta-ketoacyl-ACP synthase III [Oscillospiraceae bacterium]
MGINILGTGKYLPKTVITNKQLETLVDTSDEWIFTRTGIKERRMVDDENTTVMGTQAALIALKNADVLPTDIDVVVVSTVTPDFQTPSTACIIADRIGAVNAICLDINCACAGFIYALDIAKKYLYDEDCDYKKALIISAESLTKMTDFSDRASCILFGDGSGACVVEKADKLYKNFVGCDPTGATKLFARGIPTGNPYLKESNINLDTFPESNGHYLFQDGKAVYKFATNAMPKAVEIACQRANITPNDLDLILCHQANYRIIETAAKNLGLPLEKIFINIHKYGNSSSACIPICLNEAIEEGKIKRGNKICFVGFGAGLVYGATVLEY